MNKHPLADCDNCDLKDSDYVPSSGPDKADLVIVGQAPGLEEAKSGESFTGSSGKLLDTVLGHHKLNRKTAFLTNVALCRPKKDNPPSKTAIKCCAERLKVEISSRNPTKILALGAPAASAIMGSNVKITSFRAGPPKQSALYPGVQIIPTAHPAFCLRQPDSFPSLVADIEKVAGKVYAAWEPPKWKVVTNDKAQETVDELFRLGHIDFVIDIETAYEKDASFIRPNQFPLLCLGVGYEPGKVLVFDHESCNSPAGMAAIAKLLRLGNITAHNGKFDLSGLAHIYRTKLAFDTMLSGYCLDERRGIHKLKYRAAELFGVEDWSVKIKGYRQMTSVLVDDLYEYNALDVHNTALLEQRDKEELSKRPELVKLNNFLLQASDALMDMEMTGMLIDQEALGAESAVVEAEMTVLEAQLEEFVANPRSPKQIMAAFEERGIKAISTDRENLLALERYLPEGDSRRRFVQLLLAYRRVQKLYSTYIKGTRKRLFEGRIHTSFLLHGTTTGRLSSRNHNLQNIPRGPRIKKFFVAGDGKVYVNADYNQLELRVVCCEAEEPVLQEIFADEDRDVFWEFAWKMFGTNAAPGHRQILKRVVHGTDYGMGPGTMTDQINSDAELFGLPERYDVSKAKKFQSFYYGMVPRLKLWQDSVKDEIFKGHDDLVTPFGRHRRFWLITRQNKPDIEHEGLAFKPQSIASDINLRALIECHRRGIPLRLSVHDSLMAECDLDQAADVAREMEEVMLWSAAEYSSYCKFKVDVKMGKSWADV